MRAFQRANNPTGAQSGVFCFVLRRRVFITRSCRGALRFLFRLRVNSPRPCPLSPLYFSAMLAPAVPGVVFGSALLWRTQNQGLLDVEEARAAGKKTERQVRKEETLLSFHRPGSTFFRFLWRVLDAATTLSYSVWRVFCRAFTGQVTSRGSGRVGSSQDDPS